MNYSFPINESWTTDEVIKVVECLAIVEKTYQQAVPAKQILEKYNSFKQVITSKSEEKAIGRRFERETGYSLYKTIQQAKEKADGMVRMT